MCYYIGIEDLVANALIEVVEKTGKRTVSFSQLNEYGEAIMMRLKKDNTEASLVFNRDKTNRFFHDCSDLLDIKETPSNIYITLRNNFSTDDLRKRFRVNIALNILKAFVSEEAIKALLERVNEEI